jgi:hypothetical protein
MTDTRCKDCGRWLFDDVVHQCKGLENANLGLQWIETTLPPPFEDEDD